MTKGVDRLVFAARSYEVCAEEQAARLLFGTIGKPHVPHYRTIGEVIAHPQQMQAHNLMSPKSDARENRHPKPHPQAVLSGKHISHTQPPCRHQTPSNG